VRLYPYQTLRNEQGEQDERNRHVTGNFALYSAAGTKSGSVVYFELEPGCEQQ
jgi:hypothetical protein